MFGGGVASGQQTATQHCVPIVGGRPVHPAPCDSVRCDPCSAHRLLSAQAIPAGPDWARPTPAAPGRSWPGAARPVSMRRGPQVATGCGPWRGTPTRSRALMALSLPRPPGIRWMYIRHRLPTYICHLCNQSATTSFYFWRGLIVSNYKDLAPP